MLKSRAQMSRTTYGRAMVTCPMMLCIAAEAMIASGYKKAKKNSCGKHDWRERQVAPPLVMGARVARRDAHEARPTARANTQRSRDECRRAGQQGGC